MNLPAKSRTNNAVGANLFDVGIEIEFFLTRGATVFNAKKVLTEALGFSIDQNIHDTGALRLSNDWSLRTDGTACEAHLFTPHNSQHHQSLKWRLGLLGPRAMNAQPYVRDRLKAIKLISGYDHCYVPYLKGEQMLNGRPITFDSPGNVFSSGKVMRDAHNARTLPAPDKKERENDAVSMRTAGLHLHFSLSSDKVYDPIRKAFNQQLFGGYRRTDRLIQQLDSIYEVDILPHEGRASRLRREQYQPLGRYRVKYDTISGNPTFEYRQLDSSLIDHMEKVVAFVDRFQEVAREDLAQQLADV